METQTEVADKPKSEKVKVKSCAVKTSTDKYTIYNIELEDGRKGQSFDKLEGEMEVEVSTNKYGLQFKKPKNKFGKPFTRDYTFEKKKAALEASVALATNKIITEDKILKAADKFFEYLNS